MSTQGDDPSGSRPRPGTGRSIIDFLSDGSLAALAHELSDALRTRVELRDEGGRRIVHVEPASDERRAWTIDPDATPVPESAWRVPILAGEREIGCLAMLDGDPPASARRIVAWLARVAGEFCTVELGLRHRVREMDLMYRLSSLLIRAAEPDAVLRTALELVLDILGLDAGSVVLFSEDSAGAIAGDERTITTKASRGLSGDWLSNPLPLSKDRLFDRLAASGEVVAIENLADDPRVLAPDLLRKEGLASFISAGLSFRGRPIGVFRLYARSRRSFTREDQQLLRAVAEHSAIAIEQARLLKIQEADARVQRQLRLAEDVQRRMLPASLPTIPGIDLAARYEPTERLAGDFYDAFESEQGMILAVGDVVGHGVAAALLMASVRASLRAGAEGAGGIADLVGRVNRALVRDTLQSEFCSMFVARLEGRTLRYCGAGHEPPVLLRADGTIERLEPGGMIAGILPDAPYVESRVELGRGDTLILYTDGLVEAMDFHGARFGVDRLIAGAQAAREDRGATSAAVIERILWELRQFAGLRSRSDDLTLLVASVREA